VVHHATGKSYVSVASVFPVAVEPIELASKGQGFLEFLVHSAAEICDDAALADAVVASALLVS